MLTESGGEVVSVLAQGPVMVRSNDGQAFRVVLLRLTSGALSVCNQKVAHSPNGVLQGGDLYAEALFSHYLDDFERLAAQQWSGRAHAELTHATGMPSATRRISLDHRPLAAPLPKGTRILALRSFTMRALDDKGGTVDVPAGSMGVVRLGVDLGVGRWQYSVVFDSADPAAQKVALLDHAELERTFHFTVLEPSRENDGEETKA